MNQIQFINELDELGLSIRNLHNSLSVHKGIRRIVWFNARLKDLTYQNRIDIIRECKREMR